MLNGFEIIHEEDQKAEECVATINAFGMTFTGQTLINFKTPEYVMFGVNKATKQLGIAVSDNIDGCRAFCKNGDFKNARINFGAYKRDIAELMPEWDFDAYNYKAFGTFSKDHTEMIFSLENAEPKVKRRNRNKKSQAEPVEIAPKTVSVAAPEPNGEDGQKNVATANESM